MKTPNSNKDKKVTAAKIIAGIATTAVLGMNVNGCVYGPPIDPTQNEVPCVYGPPETFETQDVTPPETTYDASNNQNEDVYGPPEDFGFDPSDNETMAVYGPPEANSETSEAGS